MGRSLPASVADREQHLTDVEEPLSCQHFEGGLTAGTHNSGLGWFATPFLHESLIHYSTPVYPCALNGLLVNTGRAYLPRDAAWFGAELLC